MPRMAFVMELKPGQEAIYKQKHDQIWPEMLETLRGFGVRNYSIYRHGLTLFATLECDDPSRLAAQAQHPVVRRWWEMMQPYMVYNPDGTPWTAPLDEMFHMD
ncbi:MAG TPA: L-rhamnose mutarotase [Chloroflexota bacterium]|jgi:L-rhamnose mutarotase|nr:L-rhamnose mutarotase [Chloroflexota bacterium]HEX2517184.1 L-rhamnose mutarotase [Chloroflexota bacterium]